MPFKLFLTMIIAAGLLVACSSDSDNPAGPTHQQSSEDAIMPLAAGNYWIFKTTTTVNGSATTHDDTLVVSGPTEITGTPWFKLARPDGTEGQFLRNTPQGMNVYAKNTETLFLPYPTTVGTSALAVTGDGTMSVKLVGLAEPVTVTAGSFSCYEYALVEMTNGTEFTWYFEPKVGPVKMSYHQEIVSPQYPDGYVADEVRELVEYHLEK